MYNVKFYLCCDMLIVLPVEMSPILQALLRMRREAGAAAADIKDAKEKTTLSPPITTLSSNTTGE